MVSVTAPKPYEELAEALTNPKLPGWSLGSAEAGYATFSKEEWDELAEESSQEQAAAQSAATAQSAAK
jgi:hypothetical protein